MLLPLSEAQPSPKPPLRIILCRGENTSSFTVRPTLTLALLSGCAMLMMGYLGAAGYLMLRNDTSSDVSIAERLQARDYEDRIADLRARIDRITSRSLVAQNTYEGEIEALKKRQGEIDARHARVADVLARAAETGLAIAAAGPLPPVKPLSAIASGPALSDPAPSDSAPSDSAHSDPAFSGSALPESIETALGPTPPGQPSRANAANPNPANPNPANPNPANPNPANPGAGDPGIAPAEAKLDAFGLRGSMEGAARKADRKPHPARSTSLVQPISTPAASGSTASGSTASGPTASGSTASGSTASGPTASGPDMPGSDKIVMSRIENALEVMDRQSEKALDLIALTAERHIARIERVTRSLGLKLNDPDDAVGGPYEPLAPGAGFGNASFDSRLARAERAVDRLSNLRDGARSLPLAAPLDGELSVSSEYGARLDPFLGTAAMHTGVDLRAPYGTPIHATAAGTVVSAGQNGGYGLMVGIDHGNGIETLYGHMSRILVSAGQKVEAGDVIGSVGSSGRSTGAHLHYETRLTSGPVDPEAFLTAGEKLAGIL